jgi:hypothetical protein
MPKSHRGLVRGNLERVSSQVFDRYHAEIAELVTRQHGVYALYKKDRLYYVGLATNLRSRVKHHLRDRHAQKWDTFSLYLVRNVNYLKELESLLVHITEPGGNIIKGSFAHSKNLLGSLEGMMEQRDREQRERILAGARTKKRSLRNKRLVSRHGKFTISWKPSLQGILKGGSKLARAYKGKEFTATVAADGKIEFDGKIFNSPSLAASAITHRPMNGWQFWKYQDKDGNWVKLDRLRK